MEADSVDVAFFLASSRWLLFNHAQTEIDGPGSVQRPQQISIEEKEQNQVDGNSENTGELYGKA